jgi:hypothetical protein
VTVNSFGGRWRRRRWIWLVGVLLALSAVLITWSFHSRSQATEAAPAKKVPTPEMTTSATPQTEPVETLPPSAELGTAENAEALQFFNTYIAPNSPGSKPLPNLQEIDKMPEFQRLPSKTRGAVFDMVLDFQERMLATEEHMVAMGSVPSGADNSQADRQRRLRRAMIEFFRAGRRRGYTRTAPMFGIPEVAALQRAMDEYKAGER